MKTISSCVEDLLLSQPFLEEALSKGIINYSALADELKKPISELLRKDVRPGAIMMALRRYNAPKDLGSSIKLKRVIEQLGDITVRSNLTDFTFKNSSTLIKSHSKILEESIKTNNIFYAFTLGIHESNLIISSSKKEIVLDSFKNETLTSVIENLSAISIQLPENNTKITGLYYQIFKRLAWEGITIYEVVSTTNEFTILVEDYLIDKAFSAIKRLKMS